jgi:hypothetical protein
MSHPSRKISRSSVPSRFRSKRPVVPPKLRAFILADLRQYNFLMYSGISALPFGCEPIYFQLLPVAISLYPFPSQSSRSPGESARKTFALVTAADHFYTIISYPLVNKPARIRKAGIRQNVSTLPANASESAAERTSTQVYCARVSSSCPQLANGRNMSFSGSPSPPPTLEACKKRPFHSCDHQPRKPGTATLTPGLKASSAFPPVPEQS